jgi:hypothetical protein
MKNICRAGVILCIVAGLVLGNGCQKKEGAGGEAPAPSETSATKTSFKEVTSKLDAGGNLYVYLSTEAWLNNLSQKVGAWRAVADEFPNMDEQDHEKVGKIFDVVTNLIQKSGVEDISGVGMSSIEREKGVYRSRVVLHHYSGKGNGFLWTMFGKSSHNLNGLDLLPASTVVASFGDMDLGMLWSVIQQEINQTGIPEAQDAVKQLPDQFNAMTGLQLDKVLASLGNEYGLVITLDETKKLTIPFVTPALEVPEPGIVLVIKVKDETIFNRVDEELKDNPQVIKTDKDGLKMRTMPVPLPFLGDLRPSIARNGDYLFVASSDSLITEMLAVKSGKSPGLKSSEEFKRLAKGIPTQGNSFGFVSERFTKTWKEVQAQVMENNKNNAGQADFMKKLMQLQNQAASSYSVSGNTDEGWVGTGNGNQNPAKLVLLPAIIVPAAAAAVALPAMEKAKEKSQTINCINNLKRIQNAKKKWAAAKGKTDTDVPTWKDLQPYLGKGGRPKCPSGGVYKINAVGEPPTCSHEGHVLP